MEKKLEEVTAGLCFFFFTAQGGLSYDYTLISSKFRHPSPLGITCSFDHFCPWVVGSGEFELDNLPKGKSGTKNKFLTP